MDLYILNLDIVTSKIKIADGNENLCAPKAQQVAPPPLSFICKLRVWLLYCAYAALYWQPREGQKNTITNCGEENETIT